MFKNVEHAKCFTSIPADRRPTITKYPGGTPNVVNPLTANHLAGVLLADDCPGLVCTNLLLALLLYLAESTARTARKMLKHPEGIVEKVRCWNIEVNGLIVGTIVHRSIQNSGQQLSPNFRIKGLQFREETMEICPKYRRLSSCDGNDKVGKFQCCFHSCSSVRSCVIASLIVVIVRDLAVRHHGPGLVYVHGNKKTMMKPLPEDIESEEMQGWQANV
ncbi:unnamed protein product [Cuscuta campestris]|uniref:Uncharacterized protein n=1 Tax=Cuscuta campestris TaxID=132261 RepID=A0A484MQS5_9ASTE|nr:unnamed protein product [Cuscuta campestris]